MAALLDDQQGLRAKFHIPLDPLTNREISYLAGHSLGLQPKRVEDDVTKFLRQWSTLGYRGHLSAYDGWKDVEWKCVTLMAPLVFSPEQLACDDTLLHSISVGNSLTVNLNLLLAKFYNPSRIGRHKIVVESNIFPSDLFAVKSHILFHNFNPEESILYIKDPASTEEIINSLGQLVSNNDDIALLYLGDVQFFTGQAFDLKAICDYVRKETAIPVIGLDLAHAVGNVLINLEELDVDFAVWCTYKYLNSGPGSPGFYYVNPKHCIGQNGLPAFYGWWGNDPATRFNMLSDFSPRKGSSRFLISNPPILSLIPIISSLEIFQEAGGIISVSCRSKQLTSYLRESLISQFDPKAFSIISPEGQCGSQLSLVVKERDVKVLVSSLEKQGIIVDYRLPNIIRVAPSALYNTFQDCERFVAALSNLFNQ